MKNLAKKSRKIVQPKDLTVTQFKQALARHGMELTQDGNLDTISVYGFELTGKNRRAKLANAIACLARYEAEEAEAIVYGWNEAVMEQRHADDESTPVEAVKAFDQALAENPGHESEVFANDRVVVIAPDNHSGMEADKAQFTSVAVAELFESITAKRGEKEATKVLQNAVRDCGKKLYVDGKLGPYTLKLANKIPEADLLKALAARVQEQLHAEAK